MRKESYFEEFIGPGWPDSKQLERYFLAPPEQRWISRTGNDCWGFNVDGVDGTDRLEEGKGRIDIRLTMVGNRFHGVLLQYRRYGDGHTQEYYSKGDLRRLQEWVETKDGDLMPVGLFVSFETAWKAVKEFIERDGAFPESIAWIAGRDVPRSAFPDPAARIPDR